MVLGEIKIWMKKDKLIKMKKKIVKKMLGGIIMGGILLGK